MNINEQIMADFYTAFSNRDAAKMNSLYSDDIVFFDPIFELLRGDQVKSMWQMLCKNGKDLKVSFNNIQDLGEDYYTCNWIGTYTFSKTGRKVVNNIKSNMKIVDGVIVEHSDGFSVHQWSKQALGFSGWLFGWNSFFQRKIKNSAKRNLLHYMQGE